jgi:hypothetical protein
MGTRAYSEDRRFLKGDVALSACVPANALVADGSLVSVPISWLVGRAEEPEMGFSGTGTGTGTFTGDKP